MTDVLEPDTEPAADAFLRLFAPEVAVEPHPTYEWLRRTAVVRNES